VKAPLPGTPRDIRGQVEPLVLEMGGWTFVASRLRCTPEALQRRFNTLGAATAAASQIRWLYRDWQAEQGQP
jgi:hypothetical protein